MLKVTTWLFYNEDGMAEAGSSGLSLLEKPMMSEPERFLATLPQLASFVGYEEAKRTALDTTAVRITVVLDKEYTHVEEVKLYRVIEYTPTPGQYIFDEIQNAVDDPKHMAFIEKMMKEDES